MRYAIHFTPPVHDPLAVAAAEWLGRNAFSGEAVEPPPIRDIGIHDVAFNTALPRRYGFHAMLKAPFRLAPGVTEPALLRHLMRFAGSHRPFELPKLEVARLGNFFGLAPVMPSTAMHFLAAAIVQEFDVFRAPLTEVEMECCDPDSLSASQFTNLHRWGDPHVMDEFRFHMALTGPLSGADIPRFERALRGHFDPLLTRPVEIANLALFVEEEPGAPFLVHSLHPMGRVAARRIA